MARIALCEASGPLTDLLQKLSGENGDEWLRNLNKWLRKDKPLDFVDTVVIPATNQRFVARDNFVKGNAGIVWMEDSFHSEFLDKVEAPFAGSTLAYAKLSRSSVDGPIIEELGGEEKAETTLTEFFSLLQAQKNDECGPLLTNGYANVFYIRNAKGVLRAVSADWGGGGWRVLAFPVAYPLGWGGLSRVFSGNSR